MFFRHRLQWKIIINRGIVNSHRGQNSWSRTQHSMSQTANRILSMLFHLPTLIIMNDGTPLLSSLAVPPLQSSSFACSIAVLNLNQHLSFVSEVLRGIVGLSLFLIFAISGFFVLRRNYFFFLSQHPEGSALTVFTDRVSILVFLVLSLYSQTYSSY